MYLMAIDSEVKSFEVDNDNLLDDEIDKKPFYDEKSFEVDNDDLLDDEIDKKPSYDELLDDFNDLHTKYKKLAL